MNLAMMRSNTAFIDSQLTFAALRFFCKYSSDGDLAKPFWSRSRGYVYASNGPSAIRIKTPEVPPDGSSNESQHAENVEALVRARGEYVPGISLYLLNEAAEVSIAICRERNGVMTDGGFDKCFEKAFVSIPGVGIFNAGLLLDVVHAFGLVNRSGGERFCCVERKKNGTFSVLCCESLDMSVSAFVGGITRDGVIDGRWVVVEVGSLRERTEREVERIVRGY